MNKPISNLNFNREARMSKPEPFRRHTEETKETKNRLARIGSIVGRELEGLLAHFPGAEAVAGPFADVLARERLGVEAGGEEGLDFGEGIEPAGKEVGRLAVIKAAIELVAEVLGE